MSTLVNDQWKSQHYQEKKPGTWRELSFLKGMKKFMRGGIEGSIPILIKGT